MTALVVRRQGRATDGSGLRKRQLQDGFTLLPNVTLRDKHLSARATGVLALLLSLPENWVLRPEWLVAQFPEGRDAVMSAVRELRRRGYYRVERRRRPGGTWTTGVSVSDVRNEQWAAQHAATCKAEGTDRPKYDAAVRLLPDGRVEDEPPRWPAETSEAATEGDGSVTIDRKRETSDRRTSDRETRDRRTRDGSTLRPYEDGDTDPERDEREEISSVSNARTRGAPRRRSEAAEAAWEQTRRKLAERPTQPKRPARRPAAPSATEPVVEPAAQAAEPAPAAQDGEGAVEAPAPSVAATPEPVGAPR